MINRTVGGRLFQILWAPRNQVRGTFHSIQSKENLPWKKLHILTKILLMVGYSNPIGSGELGKGDFPYLFYQKRNFQGKGQIYCCVNM